MEDLVFRYQWETYMEIPGVSGADPTSALIGEGFTSFPEAKNAKEYTRKYIKDKTERTDVIGYSPSISYTCDKINGDPVVDEVVKVHENELVGKDARRAIVSVNLWEPTETEDVYEAKRRVYSIIPSNKGDGTDALQYTGTMKACSDIEFGTFNRSTKKFTATGATPATPAANSNPAEPAEPASGEGN